MRFIKERVDVKLKSTQENAVVAQTKNNWQPQQKCTIMSMLFTSMYIGIRLFVVPLFRFGQTLGHYVVAAKFRPYVFFDAVHFLRCCTHGTFLLQCQCTDKLYKNKRLSNTCYVQLKPYGGSKPVYRRDLVTKATFSNKKTVAVAEELATITCSNPT